MSHLSPADVAVSILEWQVAALVVIGATCALVATGLAAGCTWMTAKEWRRAEGSPRASPHHVQPARRPR